MTTRSRVGGLGGGPELTKSLSLWAEDDHITRWRWWRLRSSAAERRPQQSTWVGNLHRNDDMRWYPKL